MSDLTEKTLEISRVFEGRALTIDVVKIELPNGRRSTREIIRHRGAAVILGQRPDGLFVLIRQYRKSIEQVLLEMVAGGLEPGEEPEHGASREMEEESGYRVTALEKLGVAIPCPGYSEERHHLFFAKLEQNPLAQNPDFDENLEPVVLSATEIEAAIDAGELVDSKSLSLWLLYRRRYAGPSPVPQ